MFALLVHLPLASAPRLLFANSTANPLAFTNAEKNLKTHTSEQPNHGNVISYKHIKA